jgi:hypothetical protein
MAHLLALHNSGMAEQGEKCNLQKVQKEHRSRWLVLKEGYSFETAK